jgi:uncharacterized protein YjhX (UPF0386 family)
MTIVPLKQAPGKSDAQKMVRELAAAGKIVFHPHSRKRKITTVQVLNCLAKGFIDEEPTMNLSHKGWQTAVVGSNAGKYLRVVVCLRWSNDVLVITNYYES